MTSGSKNVVTAISLVLAMSGASYTTAASAAPPQNTHAANATYVFDIPAQELGAALRTFARISRQQVAFDTHTIKGKRSPPLKGSYTADDALNHLLNGSGLIADKGDSGVFIVHDPATASAVQTVNLGTSQLRLAQAETTDPESSTPSSVPGPDSSPLNEVVVTGSRLETTQYGSASPISTTSQAQIERSGLSSIYDVLLTQPQFGIGVGARNVDNYNGEVGASFANLRGLGTNRTLVLVDNKRRVSGAATSSAVDLSSIPAGLIERVEVVTGGSAAVYGADAVSGVVNVILRKETDGLQLSTRQGMSGHGDAYSTSYDVAYGGKAGERGQVSFGISYNHDDSLGYNDRHFSSITGFVAANPANTGPNDGIFDNLTYGDWRFPGTAYGGTFSIGGTRYTYENAVRPLQSDSLVYGPDSFLSIGGDGFNIADFNDLFGSSTALSALMNFGYDLNDSVRLSTLVQFSQIKGRSTLQPLFGFYSVQRTNPLLPNDVGALMDANGLSTITVGRTDLDQGVNIRDVTRTTYTALATLEGQLSARLKWEAFAQYGRNDIDDIFRNERVVARFNEAIDVIAGPNGPECANAAARAAGCLPLGLFGSDAATPEALSYFQYDPKNSTTNEQTVIGAQLTGSLLTLPAGELAFAAGLEYREESIEALADGLASQSALFFPHGASQSGDFNVKEVFAEASVPLLGDRPFVKTLDVNAAARHSDYSTIGTATTWRFGGVYAPVDALRFRVTRSRSVRAPNLNELFSPGVGSLVTVLDPCDALQIASNPNRADNCAALGVAPGFVDPFRTVSRQQSSSGNSGLNEEESNSWTAGVVIRPAAWENFAAAIDYFDIDISDAISTLAVQDILNGCVDGADLNSSLCTLAPRRPDGAVARVDVVPLNIASLSARGIDATVDYKRGAGEFAGRALNLGLSLSSSYILQNDQQVQDQVLKAAGTPRAPRFRGTLATTLAAGDLSATWSMRYISSLVQNKSYSDEFLDTNKLNARLYHDLFVSFSRDRLTLSAGINNLLDDTPPNNILAADSNFSTGGLYDVVGRFFFASARLRF